MFKEGGSIGGSTAQVEPLRTPVNAVGDLAMVVIKIYLLNLVAAPCGGGSLCGASPMS